MSVDAWKRGESEDVAPGIMICLKKKKEKKAKLGVVKDSSFYIFPL